MRQSPHRSLPTGNLDLGENPIAENELYLSVLNQASDAILITDADLKSPGPRILFANASFCRLTGYSAEQLIGQPIMVSTGAAASPWSARQDRRRTLQAR
jgi:two-component system, OmpR family, sensor kinase